MFVTDATDPDCEMLHNFVVGIKIKLCHAMFQEIVSTECLILQIPQLIKLYVWMV